MGTKLQNWEQNFKIGNNTLKNENKTFKIKNNTSKMAERPPLKTIY